jgi:hypothetical protein
MEIECCRKRDELRVENKDGDYYYNYDDKVTLNSLTELPH